MNRLDNLDDLEPDELLYLANLAEAADRHDDMLLYLSVYVQKGVQDLSAEERRMLSTAYKSTTGGRRAACRILTCIKDKEEQNGNFNKSNQVECYCIQVQQEIFQLCTQLAHLIDSRLLVYSQSIESRVFYRKLKADLLYYICEVAQGTMKEENNRLALATYQDAYNEAVNGLPPTHPLRLGVIFNFSVYLTEISRNWQKAGQMRKEGFDAAIADIENVSKENEREVIWLTQLLRDSRMIWTEDTT